jgi:hypothetical protein
MPRDNFERYRKRLEDQLRTDMGLLYEAYLAKLRAYQAVERLRGDIEVDFLPAADFALQLPAAAAVAGPVAPSPGESPRRSRSYEVIDAVEAVLERLPEDFDRFDVLALLDFEPRRSTLLEALHALTRNGVLTIVREAAGRQPMLFRKVAAGSSPADA